MATNMDAVCDEPKIKIQAMHFGDPKDTGVIEFGKGRTAQALKAWVETEFHIPVDEQRLVKHHKSIKQPDHKLNGVDNEYTLVRKVTNTDEQVRIAAEKTDPLKIQAMHFGDPKDTGVIEFGKGRTAQALKAWVETEFHIPVDEQRLVKHHKLIRQPDHKLNGVDNEYTLMRKVTNTDEQVRIAAEKTDPLKKGRSEQEKLSTERGGPPPKGTMQLCDVCC